MILIDRKPLEADALNDEKHTLHDFAKEYNDTLIYLNDHYKNGYIRFKRPGFPKHTKGSDDRGNEIPKMALPTPPMRIPLQANVAMGKLGKHLWMCCQDSPNILPNGLWDMGRTRALTIKNDLLININEDPDLAFFLYKISPFVRKKQLKVADPIADDSELGEVERELTERKYAVWNMLSDEGKLKRMARAYGVTTVDTKQPNAIRKELEKILEENDKLRRQNPAVKGTKEFLEEMNVTDGLLLRSFVQKVIDEKKLTWNADGRWKIGNKIVIQVPHNELPRKNDYLCNYLMAGNNSEKLQDFMRDFVDREYLDTIVDKKEWVWLAKIAGVPHQFKKPVEIQEKTTAFFCPV